MRIFVGLELPEAISEQLLGLRCDIEAARWHSAKQLHLTLHFLGELSQEQLQRAQEAVAAVDSCCLELRLEGVGCFGSGSSRGALWAGVSPLQPVSALHRDLGEALQGRGFTPERRPFAPHITLARLKAPAAVDDFLQEHQALRSEPFLLDQVSIFSSSPGPQGSDYEVLHRYPLKCPGRSTAS